MRKYQTEPISHSTPLLSSITIRIVEKACTSFPLDPKSRDISGTREFGIETGRKFRHTDGLDQPIFGFYYSFPQKPCKYTLSSSCLCSRHLCLTRNPKVGERESWNQPIYSCSCFLLFLSLSRNGMGFENIISTTRDLP